MARKGRGRAVNRRKKSGGGGKRLLAVLLLLALAVAGAFLVRYFGETKPAKTSAGRPAGPPRLPLPPRPSVQKSVSSVSVPAAKHEAAVKESKGAGRLAIVIDDMGASNQELQELLSIKLPLTFSVIPSLAHAKGVAQAAHEAGAGVMVHLPMEPEGYPQQRLEQIGLLLSMDDAEVARRVDSYFRSVPFATGANNHMGSRFTQDAEKMEVVLKVLREKGMFFIDSKTSPASVGYRTAKALGLKCAERQVFLDNVQDEGAIRKQLAEAVAIARKKGSAIAICHPHPATIRALKLAMPGHAASGITFVLVSSLVKP